MTKEEYEISCEGLSHCPQHKCGKKRWGEKITFIVYAEVNCMILSANLVFFFVM